jgi:flagellar biosynthesis protein
MSEATPGPDASIAVALRYDEDDGAPVVVATGRGAVADKIIETAQAAGVSIDENPMLASALESVPLDETIPQELYEAVAQVIGWVLKANPDARHPNAVNKASANTADTDSLQG